MALKDFVKEHGGALSDAFRLPPSVIKIDPEYNPRDMKSAAFAEGVAEWKPSIKERGWEVDRPMFGRIVGEHFVVTDGHTRFVAVQELLAEGHEILTIPCRLEERGTNEADRLLYALRAPGVPLNPIEMAGGIKRLLAYGWKDDKIAKRLGKNVAWVRRSLEAAEMAPALQNGVTHGEISVTHALAITHTHVDPVAAFEDAKVTARAAGRQKVRPRDIAAAVPARAPQTAPASPLTAFLAAWDAAWDAGLVTAPDDVVTALEGLR